MRLTGAATPLTKLKQNLTKVKTKMSKEEIERLQKENAQLRAEVTAYKNVVKQMNSFLSGDD